MFSSLPSAFDGFRIAQISDLHNADFGGKIEQKVEKLKPDIIVITGDSIHKEGEYKNALSVTAHLSEIAPTYYVSGNHESILSCFFKFRDEMTEKGVVVLDNETTVLERSGESVILIGMSDPAFFRSSENSGEKHTTLYPDGRKDRFKQKLKEISEEITTQYSKKLSEEATTQYSKTFRILLSHRPELYDFYISCDIDITLSGHAHGGQVRVPLIGALYAPNQGLFPRYTDGMKKSDGKYMIISRGLGKSSPMPRIFNPPEIVLVSLCRP